MLRLREIIDITFLKLLNIKDINLLSVSILKNYKLKKQKCINLNYFKITSILINQSSFDSHPGHFHRL